MVHLASYQSRDKKLPLDRAPHLRMWVPNGNHVVCVSIRLSTISFPDDNLSSAWLNLLILCRYICHHARKNPIVFGSIVLRSMSPTIDLLFKVRPRGQTLIIFLWCVPTPWTIAWICTKFLSLIRIIWIHHILPRFLSLPTFQGHRGQSSIIFYDVLQLLTY
jgi:hypothetical protein